MTKGSDKRGVGPSCRMHDIWSSDAHLHAASKGKCEGLFLWT